VIGVGSVRHKPRLRDLFNANSPLVKNIYSHGQNMASPEARAAMVKHAHADTHMQIHTHIHTHTHTHTYIYTR
jgi:hypothetical protein